MTTTEHLSDAPIRRLHALSDLHLAPADGPCVFRAHEALVALIDRIAAEPAPQCLVLNGDVFDFLQIPGYDALSLELAARRMQAILEALDEEPPARNVVAALRRFTARGHRLYCLAGNHDPELQLYTVQEVLQKRLGSRPASEIAADDDRWRLQIAGARVLGAHGHAADPFNAISGARMRKAEHAGDGMVPLPPGSELVCKVINPYRRAHDRGRPRFPFVDLLPSDMAVIWALLLLDPVLAMRRVQDAMGISLAVLVRGAMLRTGVGVARLSAGGGAPDGELQPTRESDWQTFFADAIADEIPRDHSGFVSERDQRELLAALDALAREAQALEGEALVGKVAEGNTFEEGAAEGRTKSAFPDFVGVPMLGPGDLWRSALLRLLARASTPGRDAFRPTHPDELASDSIAAWDDEADVLLTGHTHAAKQIRTPRGNTYLNTGTWLDLTPIPDFADTAAVADWLDALAGDKVPRWQGCPVAQVDADGARLLRWTGRDFQPWSEGLPAVD
jgi:UDP-2,3-diacylglucosamine pyrophosphatase LpxH